MMYVKNKPPYSSLYMTACHCVTFWSTLTKLYARQTVPDGLRVVSHALANL